MKQVIFTGAATALLTPFDQNGEISWEELEKLIEFQIEGGIDAICSLRHHRRGCHHDRRRAHRHHSLYH